MRAAHLISQLAHASLFVLALGCATIAPAADKAGVSDTIARGKIKFERTCAPCHGQGPGHDGSPQLPGTAALSRKYDGKRPGSLELRGDLTPDILGFFVRNGSGPMPGFRKTEVSDTEVAAIAAYLKHSALSKSAN